MVTESSANQTFLLVKLFATLRQGRQKTLQFPYHPGLTAGEIIDALAIPHEEVAILLVNGRDAGFDRILQPDDYISLFPPVGGG